MPTVYLVSGANRGIGLGIVAQLADRPDTVVFAGVRNPDAAIELKKLADKCNGVVHILKLTSAEVTDNAAAVEAIKETAGRLDVVIANAGMAQSLDKVVDVSLGDMRSHWEVNVGGPLILFQQTLPLLCASPRTASNPPKFIVIGSTSGSFVLAEHMKGLVAYRASKTAVHFVVRQMHLDHEEDGVVAFPICPGPVDTDMWNSTLTEENAESIKKINVSVNTVETSVKGLLEVIDVSTRETHGGKFFSWNGEPAPW